MNIIREIQKRWFPKTLKCVYRKDILEYALKHHTHNFINDNGLCISISGALSYYGICIIPAKINIIIPLFSNKNARRFNSNYDEDVCYVYWWPKRVWNTGRLDFLKWLIEQYKDDKTNLKEL